MQIKYKIFFKEIYWSAICEVIHQANKLSILLSKYLNMEPFYPELENVEIMIDRLENIHRNGIIKEMLIASHCNYNIKLDPNTIITEIHDSFTKNALEQVVLDYPRMQIIYQGLENQTLDSFLEKINSFSHYHKTYGYLNNLMLKLCNQASFYYTYYLLYNLYKTAEGDTHLLQSPKHPTIIIRESSKNSKKYITMHFYKSYLYKNIDINYVYTEINTDISIIIELSEVIGYIITNKYYQINEFDIRWQKLTNYLII